MKYTCETHVGRVIELRVFELRDTAAVVEYGRATLEAVKRQPGNVIICADHRPARIYPPEVTLGLVDLFGRINPRLERAALLVAPTNATFLMQTRRIVRESSNVQREVFTDAAPLIAWLSEIATPAELTRIRAHFVS